MEAVIKLFDVSVSTIVPLQRIELLRYEVQRGHKRGTVLYISFCDSCSILLNCFATFVSKSVAADEKLGSGISARIQQQLFIIVWFTKRNNLIKAHIFLETINSFKMGNHINNFNRGLRQAFLINNKPLHPICCLPRLNIDF